MGSRSIMSNQDIDFLNAKAFSEKDVQIQSRIINETCATKFPEWNLYVVNGFAQKTKLILFLNRFISDEQAKKLRKELNAGNYREEDVLDEADGSLHIRSVKKGAWVYTEEDRLKRVALPIYLKVGLFATLVVLFVCVMWSIAHNSQYVVISK